MLLVISSLSNPSLTDKNKDSFLQFWLQHDLNFGNWTTEWPHAVLRASLDKSTRFQLQFGAWVHFVPTSCSLWRPIWQKYYWLFRLDTNKKINATKHCGHKQNQWQTLHSLMYVTNNNNPQPESSVLQYTAQCKIHCLELVRLSGFAVLWLPLDTGEKHLGGQKWSFYLGLRFSAIKMKLLQIYQRYLKIKRFLTVAWSQNEIPRMQDNRWTHNSFLRCY